MPQVGVPLRQWATCFSASKCPAHGLQRWLPSRLVTAAMSGRVLPANQLKLPTSDWNWVTSSGLFSGSSSSWGTLSMAIPLWKGVHGMQAGGIVQSVLLKHFVNVLGLRHVHRQPVVRGATPHKVDSQMAGQGTHEVDLQLGTQGFLKSPLSLIVGSKVGAVINTGSKVKFPPVGEVPTNMQGSWGHLVKPRSCRTPLKVWHQ